MLLSFKKYDVVIDAEEYFKTSTFMALRSGKKTIGFGNLWNRRIGYTDPVMYNDRQHTILTFLDLLKPLGIKPYVPETMEPLIYTPKDTVKVDAFLHALDGNRVVCMHT
jgi:ADP-heptose:LPS heptosyltransferase